MSGDRIQNYQSHSDHRHQRCRGTNQRHPNTTHPSPSRDPVSISQSTLVAMHGDGRSRDVSRIDCATSLWVRKDSSAQLRRQRLDNRAHSPAVTNRTVRSASLAMRTLRPADSCNTVRCGLSVSGTVSSTTRPAVRLRLISGSRGITSHSDKTPHKASICVFCLLRE